MMSRQAGFETRASASAGSMVPTFRGRSKCSWMMSEYCTASLPCPNLLRCKRRCKGTGLLHDARQNLQNILDISQGGPAAEAAAQSPVQIGGWHTHGTQHV